MKNNQEPSIAIIVRDLEPSIQAEILERFPSIQIYQPTLINARANLITAIQNSQDSQIQEFDLIIKFGDRPSLENTLILEAAYAEILFLSGSPSIQSIESAILEFKLRKRNFGA